MTRIKFDVSGPGVAPARVEVCGQFSAVAWIVPGDGGRVRVKCAARDGFDETYAAFLLWDRWRCYALQRSELPVQAKRLGVRALARLPVLPRDW